MKKTRERAMIAALAAAGLMAASGAALAQPHHDGHLANLPQTHPQGDVQFLSGGIGEGQSDAIKAAAGQYRLMLTFAQRAPGGPAQYLADIPVEVRDAQGHVVLKTVSEGPYLLANLPAGSYTIKASANGQDKVQRVAVGASGTARAMFEWQ